MAKAKSQLDKPQFAVVQITETAAGTATYEQFSTSQTIRDKVGVLIEKVEYYIPIAEQQKIIAAADGIQLVLACLNNVAISVGTPWRTGVLDEYGLWNPIANVDPGLLAMPVIHDLSADPILAHPASLYGWIRGNSLASAVTGSIRITFQYTDLSDADYQDIFQTIIAQNVL